MRNTRPVVVVTQYRDCKVGSGTKVLLALSGGDSVVTSKEQVELSPM